MTENNKLVFTFDTSADKKFSITLPNIDSGFVAEDVIAIGNDIITSNIFQPKEGNITAVDNIKHVKTTITEYTF